jgi:acyl-CoA oxidase
MLMKHTQVARDGSVTEPVSWRIFFFLTVADHQPLAQLTYGALLSGRTSMVGDSANSAKKVATSSQSMRIEADTQALTIAVRYAAVRRQFSSGKNKVGSVYGHCKGFGADSQLETQIIDYPIHQRRLMVSYIEFGGINS